VVAIVAAIGSGWLAGTVLGWPYGLSQWTFAAVADRLLAGDALYRQAWDGSSPAIYLVYALSRRLGGDHPSAIRWVELGALASLLLPATALARRWAGDPRAAGLSLALILAGDVALGAESTASPAIFGGVAIGWAVSLVAIAGERPLLGSFTAGLAVGGALLFSPPLGLAAIAVAPPSWRDWRAAAARCGATLAGVAVPVLAAVIWLGVEGSLDGLRRALLFAWHLALADFAPVAGGLGFAAAVGVAVQPWGMLGAVSLVLLPGEDNRKAEIRQALALAALAALGGLGAPTVVLGLIGGIGLWRASRALAVREIRLESALGAAGLVLFSSGASGDQGPAADDDPKRAGRNELERSTADWSPDVLADTAAWLAANTPPGAPVFVWGHEPGLYALSGRPPASHFLHDDPFRVSWGGAFDRARLLAELKAHPPAAIVVQHGDPRPLLTGNTEDSAAALAAFLPLKGFLAGYVSTAKFGYLEVFAPPPPAPQPEPDATPW
jgi:hypothetical protein